MTLALRKAHFCRLTSVMWMTPGRCISSAEAKPEAISHNLSFRPAFDSPFDKEGRPLAIIFGWLVAKSKHIHKYGDFYLGKGFDVLHVKLEPSQLLWPRNTKKVVQQILDFTVENPSQPLLIHGFSVGAYLYGETLHRIQANPERYGPILKRVVGIVFDSPVDYSEIPTGLSQAVTQNQLAQKLLERSISAYMKLCYNQITCHYVASSDIVKENPTRTPTLMMYSDSDPISTVRFNEGECNQWRRRGITVFNRCFPNSPHVRHFQHYPVEYISTLIEFLEHLGLTEKTTKTRRKEYSP